eukprot:SM000353S13167  [mRNA]  locus=s353:58220:60225:+ [translate_table: standard]
MNRVREGGQSSACSQRDGQPHAEDLRKGPGDIEAGLLALLPVAAGRGLLRQAVKPVEPLCAEGPVYVDCKGNKFVAHRVPAMLCRDSSKRQEDYDSDIDSLEFLKRQGGRRWEQEVLVVGRVLCWLEGCIYPAGRPPEHKRIRFPPVVEESGLAPNLTMAHFRAAFGDVPDAVLSLGDVYLPANVTDAPPLPRILSARHNGTMATKCRLLVKPHDAIIKAARGFVREFTGANYAALHLRRSDFYRDVPQPQKGLKYWSIQQVAECISRKLQALGGVRLLFLATDATDSDVRLLQSLLLGLASPAQPVSLVRLPNMGREVWAGDLNRLGLAEDPLAVALVEKLICAMAAAFFSSPYSSFSFHIRQYRAAFSMPTCYDQLICEGQEWRDPIPTSLNLFAT